MLRRGDVGEPQPHLVVDARRRPAFTRANTSRAVPVTWARAPSTRPRARATSICTLARSRSAPALAIGTFSPASATSSVDRAPRDPDPDRRDRRPEPTEQRQRRERIECRGFVLKNSKQRAAGTWTSLTSTSWLPVPASAVGAPGVEHARVAGREELPTITGTPSRVDPRLLAPRSNTIPPAISQLLWETPLA